MQTVQENKENSDSEHDFEDSDTIFDLSNKRSVSKQECITEENVENDVNHLTHMINQIDLHEAENLLRNSSKTAGVKEAKLIMKILNQIYGKKQWSWVELAKLVGKISIGSMLRTLMMTQ